MRNFAGIAIVIILLIVGYGLYGNNQSTGDPGDGSSAELTAEAATPIPTLPVQDAADDRQSEVNRELDDERCFPGEPGQNSVLSGKILIIDPGHGGEDLGTVNSRFELHESDFVLNISHILRERLTESGADVCMTRVEDNYVGLAERATFANEHDGDAFVSVHLNSLPNPAENYTMTMWGNEAKDRFLARTILDVLRYELAIPEYNRGEPNPMDPDVYLIESLDSTMLKTAEMPAVLVEAAFLSASWEAKALIDGIEDGSHWREHQIAEAVYTGIVEYFEAFE